MVLARLLIATSVSWYHHSDLKTQMPVLEKLVTFLRMDEGKNNIKNYNLISSEVGTDNTYLSNPGTDSAHMQNCFPKKAV